MKAGRAVAVVAVAGCLLQSAASQTPWLDKLDESIFLQSPNGQVRADLSGLLDLEGYFIDQRPPGLLFPKDDFFNPRLSLFLDTRLGPHLYSLVQARFDRGFDPGARPDGASRLDEYLLRWTPFNDARLNVQAGKFATVFGGWVPRHDSWNNPFINAPLPYENVFIITDQTVPATPVAFLARRAGPDAKAAWLPIIWGPAYTSGASVFGSVAKFEYAIELKNASISSRPTAWGGDDVGWQNPTVSGRVGVRPNAAWNAGASFSHGAYLLPAAASKLAGGTTLGDFNQTTVGSDVSFAWRHWQFWAEAIASRFEVPNVGDADTIAYYLEAKYKLTPRLFTALRWNQQFFDKISDGAGGRQRWDRDIWRAEAALGWRFNRHLQGKLQYSFSRQNGPLQQGEQLFAAQLTVKF
jgi:hypothetical protein